MKHASDSNNTTQKNVISVKEAQDWKDEIVKVEWKFKIRPKIFKIRVIEIVC